HPQNERIREASEEKHPHHEIEKSRACRSHQNRLATADPIGKRAVHELAHRIGPKSAEADDAELSLASGEISFFDVALDDVDVVATHVEGRVGGSEQEPVHETPEPISSAVGRGCFAHNSMTSIFRVLAAFSWPALSVPGAFTASARLPFKNSISSAPISLAASSPKMPDLTRSSGVLTFARSRGTICETVEICFGAILSFSARIPM